MILLPPFVSSMVFLLDMLTINLKNRIVILLNFMQFNKIGSNEYQLCKLFNFCLHFAEGSKGKGKKSASSGKPVETGTSNDDVDYEWIPKSALRTPGSGKTR